MVFDEVTTVDIRGMLQKFINDSNLPADHKQLWEKMIGETEPTELAPIALYFKESPESLAEFSQAMMEKQALLDEGKIDEFIDEAEKDLQK